MYGDRIFEAVLEAGEPESGVSIHVVDPEYDSGPIVRQCKVPVLPGDSINDLKARVRAREKEFVVETLAGIAKGEIRLVRCWLLRNCAIEYLAGLAANELEAERGGALAETA